MRPGSATIVLHHSMVKLPEKPMMPRLFDRRVGFGGALLFQCLPAGGRVLGDGSEFRPVAGLAHLGEARDPAQMRHVLAIAAVRTERMAPVGRLDHAIGI